MPFVKKVSDEEIALAVPSLDALDGAGKLIDIKSPEDRLKLTAIILKAAQVIDEIEDAAIILEIPKEWITLRNMTAWTKGKALQRASIMRSQLIAAHKGQPVSQIWLGKNRLGQSDRPNQDKYIARRYNTGKDLDEAKEQLHRAFGKPAKKKRKKD